MHYIIFFGEFQLFLLKKTNLCFVRKKKTALTNPRILSILKKAAYHSYRGGEDPLYKKVSVIKKSQQGTVWLCEDENGEKAVCKELFASPRIYEGLRERNSPYFPKIYELTELCDPDVHGNVRIYEEYIEGKTLQEMTLSYKAALDAAVGLCKAVEELHSMGIIHRDIKPSNIMLDKNGSIKIVDLGSARFYKEEMDRDTVCLGTQGFAAPEQYGYSQTDYRTDIFAVGQTLRLVFENNIKFPVGYIIDRCTSFDPDKRFGSCKQIIFLLSLAGTVRHAAAVLTAAVFLTAAVSVIVSSRLSENTVLASADTSSEVSVETYHAEIISEEITAVQTDEQLTDTQEVSEPDISVPDDTFAEYARFFKDIDINNASRLTEEEMDGPLLFKAAEGIPMEYIIIDTESLKENKYAAMLFDYNGDGYDDLFQLSAYNPEGQDEYFRRLCVSVVKMYEGFPDYKVISDNTYFTSLVSTSVMEQETGMLNDGQYIQLSVLDVNSDGYNDIVLSVGQCENMINTQVFYYNNIDLEYSKSGKLNLYMYCTGQMICEGSDRFIVSDNGITPSTEKRIYSLTLEDTIEAFKYVDPNIFMYEKEDDPLYNMFQSITR